MTYQDRQRALVAELSRRSSGPDYPATFIGLDTDYQRDPRVSLGLFLRPAFEVLARLQWNVQMPLIAAEPWHYLTPARALHFTFKNVQTVADPPTFTPGQAQAVAAMLAQVLPQYPAFDLECEGLLRTPTSIGVAGYYPEPIGRMVQEVHQRLIEIGLPDNKTYISNDLTFTNTTLIRYTKPPGDALLARAAELESFRLRFPVSSLELVSADLAFRPGRLTIWGEFPLAR